MASKVREDSELRGVLQKECSSLLPSHSSLLEQHFTELISVGNRDKAVCEVRVHQTQRNHFRLRDEWTFLVHVQTTQGVPVMERSYHAASPSVQSLFLLLACMLWTFTRTGLAGYLLSLAGTCLVLSGMNVLEGVSLLGVSSLNAVLTDRHGIGLLCFALWAGWVSSAATRVAPALTALQLPSFVMRILAFAVGILQPVVFTLISKGIGFAKNYSALLRLQLILAGLGLAVMNVDISSTWGGLRHTVLLPRYLTFGLILFGILSFHKWRVPRLSPLKLPYWFYIPAVVLSEAIAVLFPVWRGLGVLTRIAICLCLVEGLLFGSTYRRITWATFRPVLAVLIGLLFSRYVMASGLTEFLTVFWNPLLHPNHLPAFTLIGTAAAVIFCGNPTFTYFSFFPLLFTAEIPGVARAALFDGLLLGWVLSPYSLLNVIPIVGLGCSPVEVFRERLFQLRLPLGIALWVYSTANLPLVQILRPITFIFLWFVALTILLYRANWSLRRAV